MDQDEIEFLKELRQDFLEEAKEYLESLESNILKYEQSKGDDVLVEFKRTLHTLKGSSRAVDLNKLSEAAHHMEDKCSNPDDHFCDYMLKALDKLKESIAFVAQGRDSESETVLADIFK